MPEFRFKYNELDEVGVLPYLESVALIDRLSGTASELTLSFMDVDSRFSTGLWRATKGDGITCGFAGLKDEYYAIDRITSQNMPAVVTWHATARPRTVKAPKSRGGGYPPPSGGAIINERKSWDSERKVAFKKLCKRVCDECGLKLNYMIKENPIISDVARYQESGFDLLQRYCNIYGYAIRATSSEVTILAAARSVAKSVESTAQPEVIDVPADSILSMTQSAPMKPSKVVSARLDPRTGNVIRGSAGDGDGAADELNFDALSPAAIYASRLGAVGAVSVIPNAKYCAGARVRINNSLYTVKEMRYNRTGDNETMSLVLEPEVT